MPTIQDVVKGDLISADLMNDILASLRELDRKVGAGTADWVVVPDVVGFLLKDAISKLNAPGSRVTADVVLDTHGKGVIPAISPNLTVIAQLPAGGDLVPGGRKVRLLVAAAEAGAVTGGVKPVIDSFAPVQGTQGLELQIHGRGFDPDPKKNIITFDDIPASSPFPDSTATQLNVIVPMIQAIGGMWNLMQQTAKTTESAAPSTDSNILVDIVDTGIKTGVVVRVKTANGEATAKCDINLFDFIAFDRPYIASIDRHDVLVGETITINGNQFSSDATKVTVAFNGTAGTVTSASLTQLKVTAPNLRPSNPRWSVKGVRVIVTVNSIAHPTGISSYANDQSFIAISRFQSATDIGTELDTNMQA